MTTDRLERLIYYFAELDPQQNVAECLTLLREVADAADLHAVNCTHSCGDVREALAALNKWRWS